MQLVGLGGRDVSEFLGAAAGPFYGQTVDAVGLANAKGEQQFGLG